MRKNISRRSFMTQLGVASAAVGGMVLPASNARGKGNPSIPNPDPDHLKPHKGGWKVWPTGVDDGANIEHALRNTEPGATVHLKKGTFKFSSGISIPDFDGVLAGAGRSKTILTCSDEYNYELWEAPGGGKDQGLPNPPPFPRPFVDGSSTRGAPGLIFFYKSPLNTGEDPADRANRIELRDMMCAGNMIGELWALGDEAICISISNTIDWHNPGLPLETSRQDVVINRVDAKGYATDAFGPFGNACACINVLGGLDLTDNYNLDGSIDGDALGLANGGILGVRQTEGDVTFSDCQLENCRLGPAIVGYKNGKLTFENISTNNCRADCVRFFDNSNCTLIARDCDLSCDSFTLPPQWAPNGVTDQPSSLGCVLTIQGLEAFLGFPQNLQWLSLAFDQDAHDAHPEAGPIGSWRPRGPFTAPTSSDLKITDNSCTSSETPNTYCIHVIDMPKLVLGTPTLIATIKRNDCNDSESCISLEHVDDAVIKNNECNSQSVGVELHNSLNAEIAGNDFSFTSGSGCEIKTLVLGEKIDFSHVVPGAGSCSVQG